MAGPESRSDAELLRESSRDTTAFGLVYDRYAAAMYRWARGTGLAEADALDLVAEVFARAWVSRKRYRDPGDGSAAPWLFGIARNLLASHRRSGHIEARARKRLRLPQLTEPDPSEAVAERVDAIASRGALDRALAALPGRHAEAVR